MNNLVNYTYILSWKMRYSNIIKYLDKLLQFRIGI